MPVDFKLSCVLFDLDGTLVDSAPDLISSLNRAMQYHGFSSVSPEKIKPYISYGAAAMIRESLNGSYATEISKKILDNMLNDYQINIAEHTRPYNGMLDLLNQIESQGLKWGVITNKRQRFTMPLMETLKLDKRAACIISGDTTPNRKPHPEPMLAACSQAKVLPKQCVYIGDSAHDIVAGKRAGMRTLAATYGYLKPDDDPEQWGADALIQHPVEISTWISQTLCH